MIKNLELNLKKRKRYELAERKIVVYYVENNNEIYV